MRTTIIAAFILVLYVAPVNCSWFDEIFKRYSLSVPCCGNLKCYVTEKCLRFRTHCTCSDDGALLLAVTQTNSSDNPDNSSMDSSVTPVYPESTGNSGQSLTTSGVLLAAVCSIFTMWIGRWETRAEDDHVQWQYMTPFRFWVFVSCASLHAGEENCEMYYGAGIRVHSNIPATRAQKRLIYYQYTCISN